MNELICKTYIFNSLRALSKHFIVCLSLLIGWNASGFSIGVTLSVLTYESQKGMIPVCLIAFSRF